MDFSVEGLFASLVISSLGFGLFMYGKKQTRVPQLVVGVAMMIFPYFVDGALWMLLIAAALLVGLWFAVRSGI